MCVSVFVYMMYVELFNCTVNRIKPERDHYRKHNSLNVCVCVCLCMGIPVLTVTFSEAHILTKEWI